MGMAGHGWGVHKAVLDRFMVGIMGGVSACKLDKGYSMSL